MAQFKSNFIHSLAEVQFPSTAEAEAKVLAGLANNAWMWNEVAQMIQGSMFSPDYRPVWDVFSKMIEAGEEITFASIATHITDRDVREKVTTALVDDPSPKDTRRAAGELRRLTLRHRLFDNAVEVIQNVAKVDRSEDELLAIAHSFEDTSVAGLVPRRDETLAEIFNGLAETLESYATGKSSRITSGWMQVDKRTQGGFSPGQLVILAARPSVGKTAFMLQMAVSAAKSGQQCIIYSLEMTKTELAERMMIGAGGLTPTEARTGQVDWDRYNRTLSGIERLPLTIDDTSRTLQEIVASLTMRVRHGNVKIAFIDYLGYIRDDSAGNVPLYQKIGGITAELKATARKLRIPIVLLCQLNRETAKGERAPELSDLRDSGSIEQDADIVMMLQRIDPPDERQPVDIAMHIRKNRRGRNNTELRFRANDTYTTFQELGEVVYDYE